MSWKSIELQVALPRVQDAGKVQEQMNKQGQHLQESLVQAELKLQEQKRKTVTELEYAYKVEEEKNQYHDHTGDESSHDEDAIEEDIEHPYLGQKIDYNG